jgi:hypothetical protein
VNCPRCDDGELLAVLRSGRTEVPLCSRCEADEPIARYFAVNGEVRPQDAERFAALLREWAERARPPVPDANALEARVAAELEAQREAWYRGEL